MLQENRIGLALGAGGVLGGAWLAGALTALRGATGWDPGAAHLMLGTSAGSVFAALLAGGVTASQLLPPPGPPGGRWLLSDLVAEDVYRLRRWPVPGPGSLALALQALRDRAGLRALCGLLPRGLLPTTAIEATVSHAVPAGLASQDCWIVACDYRDGARVVFGREDAPPAPLARAVAASCAVPGLFSPVPVDGRFFVDGGLHSLSNLDLLAGRDLDLVVALNPMSGPRVRTGWSPIARLTAAMRRRSTRQVAREVDALFRAGTEVLLLEPSERDLAEMGDDVMDARRAARVARLAVETTAERLRRSPVRALRWLRAA
jgi:NTE family protein